MKMDFLEPAEAELVEVIAYSAVNPSVIFRFYL